MPSNASRNSSHHRPHSTGRRAESNLAFALTHAAQTIKVYHAGKVKPQVLGRMETRVFAYPSLRPLLWSNFMWEGNVGVQKNWVPISMHRDHVLFTHSLEPHIVLRCALTAEGRRAARQHDETGTPASTAARAGSGSKAYVRRVDCAGSTYAGCRHGVRYEAAVRPASPESVCQVAHRTVAPLVWEAAGFRLYEGVARGNAIRAIPRGGTPCLALFNQLVCLGHFRTRLRLSDKHSTYFHFFCAHTRRPLTLLLSINPSPPELTMD
jgi:hypothetical protein